MNLDKSCKLFFGCKIDSKLREALAQCKPGERKYFEDSDSEFLRIVQHEEERWIGKIFRGGIGVAEIEDIQRNVTSIMRRIAPNVRISPSSMKVFSITGNVDLADDVPPEESAPDEFDDDTDNVVGGAYIADDK